MKIRTPSLINIAILLTCLVFGAVVSILLGQDVNWDLRNYHLYGAISLLKNYQNNDFMPAGIATNYNPLLDIPYAVLSLGILSEKPRLLAGFMGMWYGLLIYLYIQISFLIFNGSKIRYFWIITSGSIALTSAGIYCQIGTTTNEITIGVFILAGLLLILKEISKRETVIFNRVYAFAMILWGMAGGLKMTCAIYPLALCISMLFLTNYKKWFLLLTRLSVFWFIGFALTFGWWGYTVYKKLGNPLFPLYNSIFKSPFYSQISTNFFLGYQPKSLFEYFIYPLKWFHTTKTTTSELVFSDPRLFIAESCLFIYILYILYNHSKHNKNIIVDCKKTLLLFSLFSYIIWIWVFCYERYAGVFEITSTLLVFSFIQSAFAKWNNNKYEYLGCICSLLFAAAIVTSTKNMNYGRIHYGKKVFQVDMEWVKDNSLIIVVQGPAAYLKCFIPENKNVTFLGLNYLNELAGELYNNKCLEYINNKKPIYVLVPEGMESYAFKNNKKYYNIIMQDYPLFKIDSNLTKKSLEDVYVYQANRML